MKIYTTDGMRHIVDATLKNDGITLADLTQRAAMAVTYEIISRWRPSKRLVIFAGPGGNGADALAVARLLVEQGYRPEVYLFNIASAHLSQQCQECRDQLIEAAPDLLTEVVKNFVPPELGPDDVVIDGLFGSGLRTPLKGGYTALVQYINNSDAYIVSIDMPSGLFSEWNTGSDRRNIICADLTLAYQAPRLSFFFAENEPHLGQVKVLPMDLSSDALANQGSDFYMIEHSDVHQVLHERSPFVNKYDNGTLLLVAGSYGMMGAAVLAAKAALRAGVGMVTVHAPRCGYEVMQTAVPEALFEPDRDELVTTGLDLRHRYSVVALGPGMGTNDETVDAVDSFLKNFHYPCLLDADALNCIARRPTLLRSLPKRSVITPHAMEFDRLFNPRTNGQDHTDEERLKKAIDTSKLYDITIVLKGHYTMTVRPDGKVYINSTGNAGMATAGSGDVLTGTIAALIAQGYSSEWSVVTGVYAHGLAGDLAAKEHGTFGMVASDIVAHLGHALQDILRK